MSYNSVQIFFHKFIFIFIFSNNNNSTLERLVWPVPDKNQNIIFTIRFYQRLKDYTVFKFKFKKKKVNNSTIAYRQINQDNVSWYRTIYEEISVRKNCGIITEHVEIQSENRYPQPPSMVERARIICPLFLHEFDASTVTRHILLSVRSKSLNCCLIGPFCLS